MNSQKVWFVTGTSKGLGLTLVKKLLKEGYQVAATSRRKDSLISAVNDTDDAFLPSEVDLKSPDSINQALRTTHEKFNKIDVVVNNAGYGIGGAVEELSGEEIIESFDINVFATIHVIKGVMPYLRAQGSGHIINISSIAGFAATTGWAMYAATKFAVVGLSEVLAEDVKPFGIKVTVVEPGAFRTNFLSEDSLTLAANPIEDYKTVRESHAKHQSFHGMQIGDPEKAASVFIQVAESENPPLRLFLGRDAYNRAMQKVELIKSDLENWKSTTVSTDF